MLKDRYDMKIYNNNNNIRILVISKVKQECLERVMNLEHENLVLQQRYKELEERVSPLTKSLNGQEYFKEFLKILYTSEMNPGISLTPTAQNGDPKIPNAVEQLTSLLLYTNIAQKDILTNCHQLHQRVAQLEQINSVLCSIICDIGNNTPQQEQQDNERSSTEVIKSLDLSKILCKINSSFKSLELPSNKSHSCLSNPTIPMKNPISVNYNSEESIPVYTITNAERNSVNDFKDRSNWKDNRSFHPISNSAHYSPTKQHTSTSNSNLNNFACSRNLYSFPPKCTIRRSSLRSDTSLSESCSSTFGLDIQLNKNTQPQEEQQLNSPRLEWTRSKSLPVLEINSLRTNVDSILKEICLRTVSLTQLKNSPPSFPISTYPIKRVSGQMIMSSENLLKAEADFHILEVMSDLNLTNNIYPTSNLIVNRTQYNTKESSIWFDKPLPKGWLQLQNLSYSGFKRHSNGTYSHMILGARSLPLLSNKSAENWKSSDYSSLSADENHRMHSSERAYSFRNLHANNFHLKTIIEVDSGPPSFHELSTNKADSYDSDKNNLVCDNTDLEESKSFQQECKAKKTKSRTLPEVWISPSQSIEFLPNSRQILCRDQKLRYHYPLRSAVIGPNPNSTNSLLMPKSYDLETQTTYHDAFRKLRNARKDLRFGVFSDTELLTGKFIITSTEDSAIDSGDEDFHSSVDSLCVKSFLTKSNLKTTSSSLTTTIAKHNSHINASNPISNANDCNSNWDSDFKTAVLEVNDDEYKEDITPDSQLVQMNCRLKFSSMNDQNECDNFNSDPTTKQRDSICDNTKRNTNSIEPSNTPKCQKDIPDPTTNTNSTTDLQCNTRAAVPPPVVIYRRRFQKLASKRISKFSGHQKSSDCVANKTLNEIKSFRNTMKEITCTLTTINTTTTVTTVATTTNSQTVTGVKHSKTTSISENNHLSKSQCTKETLHSVMPTSINNVSENIEKSPNNITTSRSVTERQSLMEKIQSKRFFKSPSKSIQSATNKLASSSSSSSSSSQHTTKIRMPQVDIHHHNPTHISASFTKSSCSSDTKKNLSLKNPMSDQATSKVGSYMSSSLTIKSVNGNKSTASSTLTSPEIRRLRNISYTSSRSPIITTVNSLKHCSFNTTRSCYSNSSPTSPISLSSNCNNSKHNNKECDILPPISPVFDGKPILDEKTRKSSIPSSSPNTPTVKDPSLKKVNKIINKPKVNSEKLHRRIACINETAECEKVFYSNAPPPIPPRTTSRLQTYQGKMVVLKPKCLSVTNSPYTSNHEELCLSTELHANSVSTQSKNSVNNYLLKMGLDTVVPVENPCLNGIKLLKDYSQNDSFEDLNRCGNVSNLSPLSSQWKPLSYSKIATLVNPPYRRPSEIPVNKSMVTSPIISTPSPVIISTIPNDSTSFSQKNACNKMSGLNRNSFIVNSVDLSGEQTLIHPINYSSNYCNNRKMDNSNLHLQYNTTTTTITTAMPPMKTNDYGETIIHQHQYLPHLQKHSYHPHEYQPFYHPPHSHLYPLQDHHHQYHHHHHHFEQNLHRFPVNIFLLTTII
ncbi:unnamed protein product [Heterobilharzia americana]|nr:unnamed protein product [Heterobilharzia americana]